MPYQGSFVALITPFRNGEVDEGQLRMLVDFQIENGTNGLVPCGTTGEAATMTEEELVVSPYYNKPTPEGIYQHYKAIVDATDLPLVVYNVPGRTSGNVLPE